MNRMRVFHHTRHPRCLCAWALVPSPSPTSARPANREAFGVRPACCASPSTHRTQKREQAPRTPNAGARPGRALKSLRLGLKHALTSILTLALLLLTGLANAQSNMVLLISQPGDWVGQGATYATTNETQIGISGIAMTVTVSAFGFNMIFDAPGQNALGVGSYPNAARYPFNGGSPGSTSPATAAAAMACAARPKSWRSAPTAAATSTTSGPNSPNTADAAPRRSQARCATIRCWRRPSPYLALSTCPRNTRLFWPP